MIGLAIFAHASHPLVTARVGEVQTALHLLQADAVTAVVTRGFGVVGVLNVAGNGVLVGL